MAGSKGTKYYDIFLKYKMFLTNKDESTVLNEDRIELIKEIKNEGSLKAAAKKLNISYRKAWDNIKETAELLGFSLIEKHRGGKDGGGSSLSAEGQEFIEAYDELKKEFDMTIKDITRKFFRKINQ